MEDKLFQEQEEFTLEDIIREFSDHPAQPEEPAQVQEQQPEAEEVIAEGSAEEHPVETSEAEAEEESAAQEPAEEVEV